MRQEKQLTATQRWLPGWLPGMVALSFVLTAGCTAEMSTPGGLSGTGGKGSVPGSGGSAGPGSGGTGTTTGTGGTGTTTGTGGTGTTGAGGAGGAGTPGTGGAVGTGGAEVNCTDASPTAVVAPQRIVRLTMAQVANTIGALVDTKIQSTITTTYMIGNTEEETFPPLNSPREGTNIIDDRFLTLDQIASAVGKYVMDNYATVTKCATATDEACATKYLTAFAEKAYRRPLDATETTRFTKLFTDMKGFGAAVPENTQYNVYAVLSAPQFLYRYELGAKAATGAVNVALTPYELATQLAFFLTDAPPDAQLTAAAKDGSLTANIATHVTRLAGVVDGPTQVNLSDAMGVLFKLNLLGNVGNSIDKGKFPVLTQGILNAMSTEGEKFIANSLWASTSKLSDLMLSRTTFVNTDLATAIYGITPPTGATQSTFVQATLPAERSGMLTLSSFITSRARSQFGSVVARGLAIKETTLCIPTPAAPANLKGVIDTARGNLATQTAREQVAVRANGTCGGCHANFDAYGLVLDDFDNIGRHRTADDLGNSPIDTSVKLPDLIGGAMVADVSGLGQALVNSPNFNRCMTKNVMQYALSDVGSAPVNPDGCAVQNVAAVFKAAANQNFTELVKDISVSKAIGLRLVSK